MPLISDLFRKCDEKTVSLSFKSEILFYAENSYLQESQQTLFPILSPYLSSLENVTSQANGAEFRVKITTLHLHILCVCFLFVAVFHQKSVFLSC